MSEHTVEARVRALSLCLQRSTEMAGVPRWLPDGALCIIQGFVPPREILVNVKTLPGIVLPVHIPFNEMVLALKMRVSAATGHPIIHIHFIYQGRQLVDERRLCDVGVTNGSTVHMVIPFRG
eukprot:TRINITY_DN97877_c0_g1_i1.p1 TRINITY_DN97877_c0_g1~~TRINITY_DN97877_c0_g1_i1.p1  ORF type:complete len:137 (+),score=15.23 TRINITY_DN97877_c0_g1_i1:47-412(+)